MTINMVRLTPLSRKFLLFFDCAVKWMEFLLLMANKITLLALDQINCFFFLDPTVSN